MYQIDIANKQRCLKLTASYVRKVVRQTLKLEEVAEANISVAIVDDAAIHDVNRQFLKHDYPTDVISFLFKESGGSVDIGGGIRVLEPGQPKLPRGARKTGRCLYPPNAERKRKVLYLIPEGENAQRLPIMGNYCQNMPI